MLSGGVICLLDPQTRRLVRSERCHVALEPGRTSWTAVLDVVGLCPWDDAIAVTAAQVREVFQRLYAAGPWQSGDPPGFPAHGPAH